jgi:hypothetical protein
MAGLTDDETAALLYQRLNDPSITPSDDSFRERVMSGAPSVDRDSFLARIGGSAERALKPIMPISSAIDYGVRSGAEALGLLPGERQMQSFERDALPEAPAAPESPAPPMAQASAPAQPVALDPRLAQVGRPAVGGLGGGGSPLGQLRLARDQQEMTFEGQKALEVDASRATLNRAQGVSDIETAQAAEYRQAVEDQRTIDLESRKKLADYQDQIMKRTEEYAKLAPDPSRYMKSKDAGMRFAMLIGAMAGGLLAGANGGPNQFLMMIEREIDRDIDAQNQTIANKRGSLDAMRSTYGQMIQATGDARLAAREYRADLLEGAKMALKAKSDALGVPELAAQASLGINALQQKIDAYRTENAAAQYKAYQQQIAASLNARRQAEKEARELAFKWAELGVKRDETSIKQYDAETKRLEAGPGGGKEGREDEARMKALQAGYNRVEQEKEYFGSKPPGSTSVLIPGAGSIPGTDAHDYSNRVDQYNAQATLLLGPVVEAMNKGKPGAVELHTLQEKVHITPGMSRQEVASRMQTLQELQKNAASIQEKLIKQPAKATDVASWQGSR